MTKLMNRRICPIPHNGCKWGDNGAAVVSDGDVWLLEEDGGITIKHVKLNLRDAAHISAHGNLIVAANAQRLRLMDTANRKLLLKKAAHGAIHGLRLSESNCVVQRRVRCVDATDVITHDGELRHRWWWVGADAELLELSDSGKTAAIQIKKGKTGPRNLCFLDLAGRDIITQIPLNGTEVAAGKIHNNRFYALTHHDVIVWDAEGNIVDAQLWRKGESSGVKTASIDVQDDVRIVWADYDGRLFLFDCAKWTCEQLPWNHVRVSVLVLCGDRLWVTEILGDVYLRDLRAGLGEKN